MNKKGELQFTLKDDLFNILYILLFEISCDQNFRINKSMLIK